MTFSSTNPCLVGSGVWQAAFTGTTVTQASALDVDHMVPLANAHRSGAWAWNAAQRQEYANDMQYDNHLIAVTASANRAKGARGPEDWRPPDESYWCQYATDWVTIKSAWNLSVTADEWEALAEMLDTCPSSISVVLMVEPGNTVGPTQQGIEEDCDPSYPKVCIPPPPPDLNCGDITFRNFEVVPPDPHRLDGNNDGVACVS